MDQVTLVDDSIVELNRPGGEDHMAPVGWEPGPEDTQDMR